jgi:hypothetical protein
MAGNQPQPRHPQGRKPSGSHQPEQAVKGQPTLEGGTQVKSKVSPTPLCMSCDHPVPWPQGIELDDGRLLCEECLAWSRRVLLELRPEELASPSAAAAYIDANR